MSYTILVTSQAESFLKKLNKPQQVRIRDKLRRLRESPREGKSLTGRFSGLWSLRIDNYRAIYQIKDIELIVLVLKIGHRRDVYS